MEIKKYILKKFDYDVNVSNKKFYTPNETIKQKLGINVKFLEDRKNMNLTFKIDMLDNDNIDILKLKVEYILTLNNEALDITESFIKKILSKFYPIFSKLILNFYNSIGLNNVQLPEFWAKEKGLLQIGMKVKNKWNYILNFSLKIEANEPSKSRCVWAKRVYRIS